MTTRKKFVSLVGSKGEGAIDPFVLLLPTPPDWRQTAILPESTCIWTPLDGTDSGLPVIFQTIQSKHKWSQKRGNSFPPPNITLLCRLENLLPSYNLICSWDSHDSLPSVPVELSRKKGG